MNNCPENLEWVTRKQGNQHAYTLGLNPISKLVPQHTTDGDFVREFKNSAEAGRYIGVGGIQHVLRGRIQTAGGYVWKYKNV